MGKVKRRLCPPLTLKQSSFVAHALLSHASTQVEAYWPGQAVLSAASNLNHDAFTRHRQSQVWQTAVQITADLGGRMHHALQAGIQSAGSAAVMGTDIPLITQAILIQAHRELEMGKNVIGPSADGGFYFLGLQEMPPSLFDGICWGGDLVYEKVLHNAKKCELSLKLLPELADCDVFSDLQWAAKTCVAFSTTLEAAGFDLSCLD